MSSAPGFDFESVARAALAQCQDLLPRWFPAGKFHGREFVVGDLRGTPGESLSINVQTGQWADFSTDDRGGDLISLFAAMNRIKQIEAAQQLSDILGGIVQPSPRTAHVTPFPTPESPEWDGIFPMPEDTPNPPDRHPQHGIPTHIATYRDMAGRPIALVYRCEPSPGEKQVVPLTYCRNTRTDRMEWRWQSLPKPRSLYRADLLGRVPDAFVLLVEGEPKCDAANKALPENWICLSWANGANSWSKADWSMLARREVTIWPDADPPGIAAARQIADQLPHYGATAKVLDPPRDAPKGWDVADALVDGWDQQRLLAFIAPEKKRPLWYSDRVRDEKDIPRREWLAKGYLIRGSVTLIAGAGSAGKSSLFKAWSIACALGMQYSRFSPVAQLKVLSYNVEDDRDEEDRRISAALRQFGCVGSALIGNLRIIGPHDVGTLIERDQQTGKIRLTDAMIDLIQHIENFLPDVVFLDPVVELHTADENDNTGLRAVMAQLRAIAVRYKICICLAHHVRKGTVTPGDPDAVRGAGAIVGAARVVFTLCGMTDDEADKLSIPRDKARFYCRLDGAKMNYTPLNDPEWFERVPYTLDNGEEVAAASPWTPPADIISTDQVEDIKNAVCQGLNGNAYSYRKGGIRSIYDLCKNKGITTDVGIQQIVATLQSQGFVERFFTDIASRNKVKGVQSPSGEPRRVKWVAEEE